MKGILVRRKGALGDVILTSPIVSHLASIYPDAVIDVETEVPGVFVKNPLVRDIYPCVRDPSSYDLVIDMNGVYEQSPNSHIIEAYSIRAFGHVSIDKSARIFWDESDLVSVRAMLAELAPVKAPLVALHMARSWPNRTLPVGFWYDLIPELVHSGCHVLQLGGPDDFFVPPTSSVSRISAKLTISQLACLMSQCNCFVGPDSGLMHIAGATSVAIVAIFTASKSEFRLPFRNGMLGYRAIPVNPKIKCYGCLHREQPPVTFCTCERGDNMCLSMIFPDDVCDAVVSLCENKRPEFARPGGELRGVTAR